MDGNRVLAFEYPTTSAFEKLRSSVNKGGDEVGSAIIDWGPPHLYGAGRLVVVYLGSRQSHDQGARAIARTTVCGRLADGHERPCAISGITLSLARTEDGALHVDAPGLPTAVTGQRVFFGGMFTPSQADAEQKIGEPIPADCRVRLYWVATPVHS